MPRVTQGAPSTANLLDALKQRNNLTREETQEVISLLQRHGQGFDAAADAAGPSTAAMPPPRLCPVRTSFRSFGMVRSMCSTIFF